MTGKRGALAVDWELTVDDEEPIADHKRYWSDHTKTAPKENLLWSARQDKCQQTHTSKKAIRGDKEESTTCCLAAREKVYWLWFVNLCGCAWRVMELLLSTWTLCVPTPKRLVWNYSLKLTPNSTVACTAYHCRRVLPNTVEYWNRCNIRRLILLIFVSLLLSCF
jgi:hypothetical protein